MSRVIAGTVLVAWLCSVVRAQSAVNAKPADAKLEFEVASIRPSVLPRRSVIRLGRQGGPGTGDPGRVTYTLSTIRDLVLDAYSVKRHQVLGPKWLDSERFDIVAKVPSGVTKEQIKVMLQNLLVERFKLTLHRENRELPIYALVTGAQGPKLKASAATTDVPPTSDSHLSGARRGEPPLTPGLAKNGMKIGPDGCPEMPPIAAGRAGNFMMMTPSGECMISHGQSMDGFATQLSNRFDRPVIDETGLTGKYDLKLRYDPSSMPGERGGPMMTKDGTGLRPGGDDPAIRATPSGDSPPSIFDALQEQLGLKLKPQKGPVDVLVIDHVEKTPTEN